MFRYYIKNYITSPVTFVGAVLLFLAMLFSTMLFSNAYPLYLYQYSLAIEVTPYLIPVVSALPVCFICHEMRKNDTWHHVLLRSSPLRYSLGGLLAAMCSGAIVTVLASVLFIAFCMTALPGPISFDVDLFNGEEPFYCGMSGQELLLNRVLVVAANGTIWAAISYAASALTDNQYICAALPIVLYISVGYLMQSLGWTYMDPGQLLLYGNACMFPYGGMVYAGSYIFAVIALCGAVFHLRLRRRFVYG